MDRFLVVSDTHGNSRMLTRAIALARSLDRARARVDALIHLGDDHTDIQGYADESEETIVVPGIHHPDYGSGATPISRMRRFDGLTITMAHQPSDLPAVPQDALPSLALHGHTHSLAVTMEPWGLRFSPGHLARPVDRGRPATFGIVEIADGRLRIMGLATTGEILIDSFWPLHVLARGEA